MTDTQGGEAAEVVTEEGAPEASGSSQARDYETEAAKQGWRPKDEWSGEPEHWKDARTWVENGDTKARIAKLEKDHAERYSRLERVTQKAVAAVSANYEKQIADLKAEKKAAIKEGDADRVEEIDQRIDDLKGKKSDDAPKAPKSYDDYADDYAPKIETEAGKEEHGKMVSAFMAANPWMIDEPDMAEYAEKWSQRNAAANPTIGFKANTKATVDAVRRKFPAFFADKTETAANGHAAVDAGGAFSGSTRTKKVFSDLPKEAQATYDRFDPKIKAVLSKEQYTKEYLADA